MTLTEWRHWCSWGEARVFVDAQEPSRDSLAGAIGRALPDALGALVKIVAKGTLEERMLTMLARKRDLASALLEGEGNALTGLTVADVDALLAPISSLQ